MPRATRISQPGLVWHLTHRCHNREFLLKFERDRRRWKHWLFQAKMRFGLSVLNYIATSNHIHLLVHDTGGDAIARSMQLAAGCVAQEYNRRKSRKGGFWQDRYFATAVAVDRHLIQCLVYIDLNMVRAGVVQHPSQWAVSGYHEIQRPPLRYRIVDHAALCRFTDLANIGQLKDCHREWIESELSHEHHFREPKWTEYPAVGSDDFVRTVRDQSGLP